MVIPGSIPGYPQITKNKTDMKVQCELLGELLKKRDSIRVILRHSWHAPVTGRITRYGCEGDEIVFLTNDVRYNYLRHENSMFKERFYIKLSDINVIYSAFTIVEVIDDITLYDLIR